MHSFLRLVMMLSTPSEGSEALPDMRAATDLDLNTCLYRSTCKAPMHAVCLRICVCRMFPIPDWPVGLLHAYAHANVQMQWNYTSIANI